MIDLPLSVAVGALIHNNKILLLKRVKGDYTGFWAMPGGKIERQEHVSTAALREIFEETGIKATFKEHLGVISELFYNDKKVHNHFLIHLCLLNPENLDLTPSKEGELAWFDLSTIGLYRDQIIHSDFLMIEAMIKRRGKNYYDCIMDRVDDKYILKKFTSPI